jgi:hypothetical protein
MKRRVQKGEGGKEIDDKKELGIRNDGRERRKKRQKTLRSVSHTEVRGRMGSLRHG